MSDEKEKQITLKMENVAIPEVKVCGCAEEIVEEPNGNEDYIDFSGAVPEVRVKKK